LIRAEGENVYVKNRTNEISVDCDAKPWNRPNPVRLADALLYCGNIIHLSGEKTESLPATLQAKVSEFVTRSFVERDRGTKPGVAAFAEDRGQLKIAALNTGMDDAPLGYMSIDTATFKDKGVVTLPFSGKDFRILNNYRAFFRTGLVIQPRARSPRSIHTCISSTCETVILSGTYEFMWIEDDGRTLYLLERENVATPIIKLKIIRK
jgi:hypothetical protein